MSALRIVSTGYLLGFAVIVFSPSYGFGAVARLDMNPKGKPLYMQAPKVIGVLDVAKKAELLMAKTDARRFRRV